MWVPGAPRFAVGQEVVLCLEPWLGGYRTVSMGFSAFAVRRAPGTEPVLERLSEGLGVVGGPVALRSPRRRHARGLPQRRLSCQRCASGDRSGQSSAQTDVAGDREYTLLGNLRWHQVDNDTPRRLVPQSRLSRRR